MTVGELKEMLEEFDDSAEVLLVTQESWPFESSVRTLLKRETLLQAEQDADAEDTDAEGPFDAASYDIDDARNRDSWSNGGRSTDCLLVDGGQIRYGSKKCWNLG